MLSQWLNVNAGNGVTYVNVEELTGAVNATGYGVHVISSTSDLLLGNINVNDPTFYNDGTQGGGNDITIGGNITTTEPLALVATGNINTNGDYTIAARDSNRGYDITLVAGALIQPVTAGTTSSTVGPYPGTGTPAPNPVTITGASTIGGDIDFSNHNITINSSAVSGNNSGGNVKLIAYEGTTSGTGGHVLLSPAAP